jgi:chemotaxis protein methyltransferase CheR
VSLTLEDADYVRDVVRARSAIVLDAEKGYLIESRLAPIARQAGMGSLSDLVAAMRCRRGGPLHDLVVDAMTTNETTFYRDLGLWSALERRLVPDLLRAREASRTLTIWCAACSSGQEPYSVAMMLVDRFPQVVADWNVRIIATDLSGEMLGRAASGCYTQLEVNRGLPAPTLLEHFVRDGAYWQVSDRIRQMVEFRMVNLVEPWPFIPAADLLFIRNVLIYFDLPTKRQILGNCRRVLRPDGHLILGTAETTLNIDDTYERIVTDSATTYRPR